MATAPRSWLAVVIDNQWQGLLSRTLESWLASIVRFGMIQQNTVLRAP